MTLLFVDGFEGYSTADTMKFWDSGYVANDAEIAATGRRGGNCLYKPYSGYNSWHLDKTITTPTGGGIWNIVGFAFRYNSSGGDQYFLEFITPVWGGGAVLLKMNDAHQLQAIRIQSTQASVAETYLTPLEVDTWYYIEIKVIIHNVSGRIVVNLNEQQVIDWTGDNLPFGSSDIIETIRFEGLAWSGISIDDIYIADDQGTGVTDFLGDIRIDAINPNGAGNYTQFTPSAGANYECVDEASFDDTDYVSDLIIGNKDSYAYADVPIDLDDAGIIGVELLNVAERTAGTDNIKMKGFLRTGSTDYEESTAISLPETYSSKRLIWEKDPSDSNIWTQAKINACEFGMEVN
jgi:hypothetical protein